MLRTLWSEPSQSQMRVCYAMSSAAGFAAGEIEPNPRGGWCGATHSMWPMHVAWGCGYERKL